MLIPPAAVSALRDEDALVGPREVGEDLARFFVPHDRTDGQEDFQIVAPLSMAVGAEAVLAAPGAVMGLMPKGVQRVQRRGRADVHVAAVAPVAAGRAAPRNEFFATERDTPVSAVSGGDHDLGFIDEHETTLSKEKPRPAGLFQSFPK